MGKNNKYIVITSDIIESKKNNIKLDNLNEKLSKVSKNDNNILTEFKILRGDEIQVIIETYSNLPKILRNLRYILYPYKIRIGIGIGEILEKIEKGSNPWEYNGDAFFKAREAIESIKKSKSTSSFLISDNEDFNKYYNNIYRLLDIIYNKWRKTQWEAVQEYEKLKTFELVSKSLGISISAAQERIKSANWYDIKKVETDILKQIQKVFPGYNEEK